MLPSGVPVGSACPSMTTCTSLLSVSQRTALVRGAWLSSAEEPRVKYTSSWTVLALTAAAAGLAAGFALGVAGVGTVGGGVTSTGLGSFGSAGLGTAAATLSGCGGGGGTGAATG